MKRGEVWLLKKYLTSNGKTVKQRKVVLLVNKPRVYPHNFWFCAEVKDWSLIFDKYEIPYKLRIEPNETNGFTKTIALCPYKVSSPFEADFIKKVGEIDAKELWTIIEYVNETSWDSKLEH